MPQFLDVVAPDRPMWFSNDARDLRVDMGRSPALLARRTYPVLDGVDGRVTGTLRRDPGNELWTNMRTIGLPSNLAISQVVPISVTAGDSFEVFSGLLLKITDLDTLAVTVRLIAEPASGGDPVLAGFTVLWSNAADLHAASRGKFMYLVDPKGREEPKVVWLESGSFETGTWRIEKMGTQLVTSAGVDVRPAFEDPEVQGAGISFRGQYQFHWRLVDTNRSRHTRLSIPAVVIFNNNEERVRFQAPSLSAAVARERRQYNRWEAWGTVSTLDPAHAAGGRTFFMDSWDVNPDFRSGLASKFVDRAFFLNTVFLDTATADATNIGDETMAAADALGTYDFVADDAAAIPPPADRIAVYQDITVLASREKPAAGQTTESAGTVTLRWSPSHRLAPEEFPSVNSFPTKITRGKAAFLEVSEYLYVLGDGPYYRMQRRGSFVEIFQMGSGQALVNPEAACVVGNQIFGIMEHGAVFITPADGSTRDMRALDRVLRDRWFYSPRIKAGISCAYDNRMKAIFIQSGESEETIILWTKTGAITVRSDALFRFARQVEHVEGSKALFLASFPANFICEPRAYPESSTEPQSMFGLPENFPLNQEVVVVNQRGPEPGRNGDHTELFLGGFRGVPRLDLAGMSLRVLTGKVAGQGFKILEGEGGNGSSWRVVISGDLESEEVLGELVSIGAVNLAIVGGPLASGDPVTTLRKSVEGARVVVSRFRGDTDYLEAGSPIIQAGVLTYEELISREPAIITFLKEDLPYRLNDWVPVLGDASGGTVLGHAGARTLVPSDGRPLSATNQAINHGTLEAAGTLLFPFVRTSVGNFSFELHEFAVSGTIGPSEYVEDVADL